MQHEGCSGSGPFIDSCIYVDLSPHLLCCICHQVFTRPMNTISCGHTFCFECISHWLLKRKTCPEDRSPLDLALLTRNIQLERVIGDLEVRCGYEGCNWFGKKERHRAHVEECPFVVLPCNVLCGMSVRRKDLQQHQDECDHRLVDCSCATILPYYQLADHIENECLKTVIPCPHQCGEQMERRLILPHSEAECKCADVSCDARDSVTGELCGFVVKRKDLTSHQQDGCLFRLTNCPYDCGTSCTLRRLPDHDQICELKPVSCRFCNLPLIRRQEDAHSSDCTEVIIKCDFLYFGCVFECRRGAMVDHKAAEHDFHMSLLLRKVDEETAWHLHYQQADSEKQERIQKLEAELAAKATENEELLARLEAASREARSPLALAQRRLEEQERRWVQQQLPSPFDDDRLFSGLGMIRTRLYSVGGRPSAATSAVGLASFLQQTRSRPYSTNGATMPAANGPCCELPSRHNGSRGDNGTGASFARTTRLVVQQTTTGKPKCGTALSELDVECAHKVLKIHGEIEELMRGPWS
mmetsp:Transcript_11793/g.19174  ORF Transcript_11793/g.19174 Transcript_11793/m.19174 type:complete len:527 (+) Transcript_11793:42-1622(+)